MNPIISVSLTSLAILLLVLTPAHAQVQNVKEYLESQVPVINVNSISADSSGMTLSLEPYRITRTGYQPSIIDIEYILQDGDLTVFTKVQRMITLVQPEQFSLNWKVNLEAGRQYTAQADIYMYINGSPALVRASKSSFTAVMDADIIDVYGDAKGASATIRSRSMVPLDSEIVFSLFREESLLETATVGTPRITANSEDETVNILWNSTMQPGTYEIRVRLMDKDRVIDRFDKIFQNEKAAAPDNPVGPVQTQTPGFTFLMPAAVILTFYTLMKRK